MSRHTEPAGPPDAAAAGPIVHGFPHLFVVNGPNGGLGHNSAVYMIEAQLDLVLDLLDEPDAALVEAQAETAYTAELDAASAETVWLRGGCRSWYLDEHGVNRTLWSGMTWQYWRSTRSLDTSEFEFSGIDAQTHDLAVPGVVVPQR